MLCKGPANGVYNIAHRGARSLAPENTLAAAKRALDSGADMWELDVCMTADGELLVVHDATLARTSDASKVYPSRRPWNVCEFTLEEIRRLDFGSWFGKEDPFGLIASGEVSGRDVESYAGEGAPTLAEALAFTLENDWLVNVELKDLTTIPCHADVVEKTVALIADMEMAGRVLLSSFNHGYIERAKVLNSKLTTGALVKQPHPDPASLLHRVRADAYHPWVKAISPGEIGGLRDQGFDVFVWVANDESTMRELIENRAAGLFTDFPQLASRILLADAAGRPS